MGNITTQLELKKSLECKSFDWFVKNIAYDMVEKVQRRISTNCCVNPRSSVSKAAAKCPTGISRQYRLKKLLGYSRQVRANLFYRTRVRSFVMLVTHSLTNCCLVNLIDVTLACEDAFSKLVEVITGQDFEFEVQPRF